MTPATGTQSPTLAQQLTNAPLTVSASVRCALQLADAFRAAHERQAASGALDPEKVTLSAVGAEIQSGGAPVYVAPEVKSGKPADARSDVFVFGCVLYRLLTGRDPVFGPEGCAPLGTVYDEQGPVRADQIAGLERLVQQCLAQPPDSRLQRMQKVFLELKLLRVSARRPQAALALHREKAESAIRAEISRVERSLAARVDASDRTLVEVQRTSNELRDKLQGALDAQQALKSSVAAVEAGVVSVRDLTTRLQTGMEENSRTMGCVEDAFSGQFNTIEEQLRTHTQSLDTMRTTMSQTDDLLERVVEAFDTLQASILEQTDMKAGG
jgi:serine/threonine protein kinase